MKQPHSAVLAFLFLACIALCSAGQAFAQGSFPSVQAQQSAANQASQQAALEAARAKREKEKKQAIETAELRAQERARMDAAAPAPADPAAIYKLHDGDEIALKVSKEINSKSSRMGDPVFLELANDLAVNGVVVARAGDKAMGEVIWIEKKSFLASGEIQIRLNYLRVGERKIPLRGGKQLENTNFTTQTKTLKVGDPVKAYIGDDVTLPPA